MTIFELSRTLGEAIRDTKETQRALAAREVFDADADARALLEKYSELQQQYNGLLSSGNPEGAALEGLGQEIKALSETIQKNAVITEVMESENAFNELIKGVFGIINATITGEDENGGCSGGCSSCGGGCGGCR